MYHGTIECDAYKGFGHEQDKLTEHGSPVCYQMDNATCLGCGHVFASHKKLNSHEPWCDAYHQYSIDLDTTQRHLQKSRRKQRKSLQLQITVPSSNLDDGVAISLEDPDVEVQVSYEVSSYTNFNGHVRPLKSRHNHYQPH